MQLKFILLLSVVFFTLSSQAASSMKYTGLPPDSTTSILDKSAALLILEEGKRLFSEGKVRDALNQFRDATTKDPNSWRPYYWIASCHYAMSNYGFALQYANRAFRMSPDVDKEIHEIMGKSYHQIGKLDSAIINYQFALTYLSPNRSKELEVEKKIAECKYAKSELSAGMRSKRIHLDGDINTGFNDYGPILSADGKTVYFTSRRNNTKGSRQNPDDQEYFEDVYRGKWDEATQRFDSITNDIDRINTIGFDAFSHMSTDGLSAMMTVNTTQTNLPKVTKSSDIFELFLTNKGKWSTPKRIANKTINTTYFDAAPTVTADGNTMYFVSDRNGQKKCTDIYMAKKEGKTWGDAVALSDSVNSTGFETTPYITPDGKYLFFSSDGHLGMGGMDVFVSENLGNNWSKPKNLGAAVNTVNNDTHFKYYAELKKAIMAGFEIVGQKSSMDIYMVDMDGYVFPTFF
jgi:tetratricopeptide (TPR) repeat protein